MHFKSRGDDKPQFINHIVISIWQLFIKEKSFSEMEFHWLYKQQLKSEPISTSRAPTQNELYGVCWKRFVS